MKKLFLINLLAVSFLSFNVQAQTTLTAKEEQQVKESQRWVSGQFIKTTPALAEDGSVRFLFGAHSPTIVCAVLQLCDIGLEVGEQMLNVNLGDNVRWGVTAALSGAGSTERQHLIIKPRAIGLETTLIVSTDRRVYHMKLKSTKDKYMASVSFTYPEDQQREISNFIQSQRKTDQREVLETGQRTTNLNFNYNIHGNTAWTPLRVYDDGQQTFIQMPKSLQNQDAPIVLVVEKTGENGLVNYRIVEDRYIIDGLFNEVVLVSGVGRKQEKTTIKRGL